MKTIIALSTSLRLTKLHSSYTEHKIYKCPVPTSQTRDVCIYLTPSHVFLRPGQYTSYGSNNSTVLLRKLGVGFNLQENHPCLKLVNVHKHTHMVMDYLGCVVSLSVSVELTKVIHQWPHAGRKVNHSVHQLSQWDPPCNDCPKISFVATYNVCMQHTEFLLCLCFPHIEPKTSRT